MKRAGIIILVILLGGLMPAAALATLPEAAAKIITAASTNRIEIGLSYRGDSIHFFGVNPVPGSDLIIRLTAEKEEAVKLSVKGRFGPFWMTVKQYEVTGAPFMYKIHASKPMADIISPALAQDLVLGYDAIKNKIQMHMIRGDASTKDTDMVFQGLIKIKEDANLYNIVEDPKRLEITENRLFKHYFRFPPAATEGNYVAESFSFQNGQLVGYGKDIIEIRKVGLEHWLTQTSQNSPVFYGIMCVVLAVGIGLLVGVIFKKGGHH